MSELKLPPEDMAEIDRRFWTAVEKERWVFQTLSGTPLAFNVGGQLPDGAAVTGGCQIPGLRL